MMRLPFKSLQYENQDSFSSKVLIKLKLKVIKHKIQVSQFLVLGAHLESHKLSADNLI